MNCSDSTCERAAHSRGMCQMHYQRWRRSHASPPSLPLTAEQQQAVKDCRATYTTAADARARFLQAAADAVAAGIPESRLSVMLGLSDAAVRMLRKRGQLPPAKQQLRNAA